MFRLAHISDVHLAPLPKVYPWQLLNKRITGYLNWVLNRKIVMNDGVLDGLIAHMRANSPNHIAVTGDLVNLALPREIIRMKRWLEELGPSENVSVILGNHDTYVPGAQRAALAAWQDYLLSDEDQKVHFPYLRAREDVVLLGVNSGGATMPFMATGRVGRRQSKRLSERLRVAGEKGQFRVVMIHHPPFPRATVWTKRLTDDERFRDVISAQGAELILHGHTHINSFETIEGPNASVPVIGVPSASQGLAEPVGDILGRPAAAYNLFDIDKTDGNWACEYREFGYAHKVEGITLLSTRTLY